MRANQRAVAFDHHQRAVKAEFGHDAFRCGNQLVEKISRAFSTAVSARRGPQARMTIHGCR